MKKRMKGFIFSVSIFYSIIVLFFMVINLCNAVTSVELIDSKENKTKLTSYKQEILVLDQNSCTNVINNLINYYEQTSYNGEISLKEMYNLGNKTSLLSFYSLVKNQCKLSEKTTEKYNFPTKFLAASIQQDELFHRYYFQYELNIKDVFTRNIVEASMTSVEYKIRKNLELEIISDLIEIMKEGESLSE